MGGGGEIVAELLMLILLGTLRAAPSPRCTRDIRNN